MLVGGQSHGPVVLSSANRPGVRFTGGGVSPTVGLEPDGLFRS